MKKIIIILLLTILSNSINAQIKAEKTYIGAGSFRAYPVYAQLYIVHLEVDGEKYVFVDRVNKALKFYNLDHSFWKSISFALATDLDTVANTQNIMYISQHLFDTDNEIEFIYGDMPSITTSILQIINEDGSILFTEKDAGMWVFPSVPAQQLPIYNTNQGTKMILSSINGNATVYSLPGTLANGIKGVGKKESEDLQTLMAYPNPTSSFTNIDYTLPNGINKGEIVFYDIQGKEVKRFNVDSTFNTLVISTDDLQSGIYYYNLQTTQGASAAKKLITIK